MRTIADLVTEVRTLNVVNLTFNTFGFILVAYFASHKQHLSLYTCSTNAAVKDATMVCKAECDANANSVLILEAALSVLLYACYVVASQWYVGEISRGLTLSWAEQSVSFGLLLYVAACLEGGSTLLPSIFLPMQIVCVNIIHYNNRQPDLPDIVSCALLLLSATIGTLSLHRHAGSLPVASIALLLGFNLGRFILHYISQRYGWARERSLLASSLFHLFSATSVRVMLVYAIVQRGS